MTIIENQNDKMVDIYNSYLEDTKEEPNNGSFSGSENYSEITKEMGYVSSVEDAKAMLEKLYNTKSKAIPESETQQSYSTHDPVICRKLCGILVMMLQ